MITESQMPNCWSRWRLAFAENKLRAKTSANLEIDYSIHPQLRLYYKGYKAADSGKDQAVFSKKVRDPDEKFDGIDEGTDI